jgi:hypothetical protein
MMTATESKIMLSLIKEAKRRHGDDIKACGTRAWGECFVCEEIGECMTYQVWYEYYTIDNKTTSALVCIPACIEYHDSDLMQIYEIDHQDFLGSFDDWKDYCKEILEPV